MEEKKPSAADVNRLLSAEENLQNGLKQLEKSNTEKEVAEAEKAILSAGKEKDAALKNYRAKKSPAQIESSKRIQQSFRNKLRAHLGHN